MTNIGTAPYLDRVHAYIDTCYFTTTLLTATVKSSTATLSYHEKIHQIPTGNLRWMPVGEFESFNPRGPSLLGI
jgi:hypothetical protein